jgi:hypothetical protein
MTDHNNAVAKQKETGTKTILLKLRHRKEVHVAFSERAIKNRGILGVMGSYLEPGGVQQIRPIQIKDTESTISLIFS